MCANRVFQTRFKYGVIVLKSHVTAVYAESIGALLAATIILYLSLCALYDIIYGGNTLLRSVSIKPCSRSVTCSASKMSISVVPKIRV